MRKHRYHWLAVPVAALLAAGGAGALFLDAAPAFAAACSASGDTSTQPNSCGPYTDANIWTGSAGSNLLVQNDVWSPPAGYTNQACQAGSATPCETINSDGPEAWSVTANLPNNAGAVESYPDVAQYYTLANNTPDPITNYTNLVSSFTDAPAGGSGNSYDVGYDIWGGSVAGGSGANYNDEIMIWTSQLNRGGCGGASPALTGIQFGGANGVPVQSWNLYNYGSERIWCSTAIDETNSSVDVYGMLHYLMAPGYNGPGSLPSDFGLNSIQYGVENCYTSGYDTFSLSKFTLTKGAGSGVTPPAASSGAATGITSSGATFNGSVNPEGTDTTYKFDYGTSTNYSSSIPVPAADAGAGTGTLNEMQNVTGLAAGTLYHYRIEASNAGGTSFGSDETFTTSGGGSGGAVTVTGSATSGQDSVMLKTFVVDGAQTGGSVVTSGTWGTPHFTLTPQDSGSLVLQGVYNAQDGTAITPVANVTNDDHGVSGNGLAFTDGRYTGTVTAGTAVSLGGSDSNAWNSWSGYEAEPAVAGTPPSVDATTPAEVTGSTSSATTASFAPPAGSLLVAIVQADGSAAQAVSVSNTGQSLAWTQAGTTYSPAYEGTEAVFTAIVPGSSQQPPAVTTNAATGITSSAAALNGSVNPEGASTTYQFEYGTSTAYGTVVPVPAGPAGSGTGAVSESASLTGLAANTTYHYRIDATNSGGTADGSDQSFTTSAAAQAPAVTTSAATGVTSSAATLNGTVNPEGQSTAYQYQYGTTTSYGSVAPAAPGTAGSGSSAVSEPAGITGLAAGTTYHFRITATNATGTSNGSDMTFTTPSASVLLVGDNATESSADSNGQGQAEAFQYTAAATGTSAAVHLYVDSTSSATAGVLGIYTNSSGHPGTLLKQVSFTPVTGWETVTLPGVAVTSGTSYWLAELGTSGTLAFRDQGSGATSFTSSQTNLTSLPATWSNGQGWGSGKASLYVSS